MRLRARVLPCVGCRGRVGEQRGSNGVPLHTSQRPAVKAELDGVTQRPVLQTIGVLRDGGAGVTEGAAGVNSVLSESYDGVRRLRNQCHVA